MRVHALVRDRVIVIDCGEGYQRVKWLAMVATQRFDDLLAITDGGYAGVAKKHVPVGLEDEAGRKIPPTKTVNRLPAAIAAADGVPVDPEYEPRVRVLLLDDAQASHKSGTSSFLTAIAAVPDMCLVAGPGLLSCVPKREATFTVYCRDNFSIPITNGGEDLSVQFTNDSGVALRAAVHDHADGARGEARSVRRWSRARCAWAEAWADAPRLPMRTHMAARMRARARESRSAGFGRSATGRPSVCALHGPRKPTRARHAPLRRRASRRHVHGQLHAAETRRVRG